MSLARETAKTRGVADPLAVKGALVQDQGAIYAALQSTASVRLQDGGRSNFPVPEFSCGLGPSFSKGVKLGLQQGADTCKVSESARSPARNEPEIPVPSATPLSHLPQTDDSLVGKLPPNNSFAGDAVAEFLDTPLEENFASEDVTPALPKTWGTDDLLLIELCAGTAILSRTAKDVSCSTSPIPTRYECCVT